MSKLSPPWYTLWNEIKHTIGNDPEVKVSSLDVSKQPYVISIIVDDRKKGEALTSLMVPSHQLGNIEVVIIIQSSKGVSYEDVVTNSPDEIASLFNEAFRGNPLFEHVVVQQVAPYPNAPTTVYPIFSKTVIQFFNDDLTDLYHNYNNVAATIFKQILMDAVNGISIGYTTAKK